MLLSSRHSEFPAEPVPALTDPVLVGVALSFSAVEVGVAVACDLIEDLRIVFIKRGRNTQVGIWSKEVLALDWIQHWGLG